MAINSNIYNKRLKSCTPLATALFVAIRMDHTHTLSYNQTVIFIAFKVATHRYMDTLTHLLRCYTQPLCCILNSYQYIPLKCRKTDWQCRLKDKYECSYFQVLKNILLACCVNILLKIYMPSLTLLSK